MRSEKLSEKRINKKILEKIFSNPKITASKQVVRNRISDLRRNNAGISLNAACHLYAQSKGFSLMKYLGEKDRISLQYAKKESSSRAKNSNNKKIRKPKGITTRFGMNFESDANKNAKIYPYIYLLENSLRHIILTTFIEKKDWWVDPKIVHPDIREYATKIQNAESKYKWMPDRGNHPIYYVGLYELFKIIEKNWNNFKIIFGNLENLRTWINEIIPIRHLIAHNVKTRKDDYENARIRTTHVCTMIEKTFSKSKK